MRWVVAVVVAWSTSAAADPAEENLLPLVKSTIAVSSTVANAKILPKHLVDGDLTTAWNSRTGDLAGASIKIRMPYAGFYVDAIAMTAGFTKGDLFEQNGSGVMTAELGIVDGTRLRGAKLTRTWSTDIPRAVETNAVPGLTPVLATHHELYRVMPTGRPHVQCVRTRRRCADARPERALRYEAAQREDEWGNPWSGTATTSTIARACESARPPQELREQVHAGRRQPA